jgi:hypothetical protein
MSQPPTFNPYSPPNPLYGQTVGKPVSSAKPAYLQVLCVISLVLGSLGALRGGCVAVTVATGGGKQQPNQVQNIPPALQESMQKFQAEADAIDTRYGPLNKAFIFLQAAIGVAMAVGAAMVMQAKRPGDWVLRGAYVATLVVGAVSMVPFVFQMLEMQPLLTEITEKTKGLGGQDAAVANILIAAMTGAMYGGICMGGAWLVVKLGLFGHGIFYLGKPSVQEYLA